MPRRSRFIVPIGCVIAAVLSVGSVVSPSDLSVAALPSSSALGAVDDAEASPTVDEGAVVVPELATESSNTYENTDGSFTTMIAPGPVNYDTGDGDWAPISNELVDSPEPGYAVENEANSYTVSLPEDPAVTPVRFETAGEWLTMKLVGSDDVAPDVDGSEVTYEDLTAAADAVTLEATDTGVKETVVLESTPTGPINFRYNLDVSAGLTPELVNNTVQFRDGAGSTLFVMPPPSMEDSAAPVPAYSDAVTYTLAPIGTGWRLTVRPDADWLADPARVYPVLVDPTVDKGDQKDCWIQSDMPNSSRCGSIDYLWAGTSQASIRRGLLDFGVDSLPAGARVDNANLFLWLDSNATNGADGATGFRLFHPSNRWAAGVSWNHSGIMPWSAPGGESGYVLSPTMPVLSGSTGSQWVQWNVQDTVARWFNGSLENRGLMLRSANEGSRKQVGFLSGTNQLHQWRPILRIDYSEVATPPASDPVMQQILALSRPGTTVAQVNAVVNGVVTGSGEDGTTPLGFDQAKREVLDFLIATTDSDESTAASSSASAVCEWEVKASGTSATVTAPGGSATSLARVGSSDPKSPSFTGTVDGQSATLTVWQGATQTQINSRVDGNGARLASLADASMAGAIDNGGDQEVNSTASGVAAPTGLVTVGYRLELPNAVERGVPGGECVRTSSAATGTVELNTPRGRLGIPRSDSASAATAASSVTYPSTTSAFRIRSFIPEAEANTRWVCGRFAGDNRGYTSYYEARNRTRESVFFNWPTGTMDFSKHIGATHRLAGYGRRAKSRTASADGILFLNPSMSSSYGSVTILQAVGNPLCSWSGPIQFDLFVEAWKNGAVRISGEKRKVPNYEAYYYPRSEAYGTLLYRKAHSFFVCLTLNCGDDDISASLN